MRRPIGYSRRFGLMLLLAAASAPAGAQSVQLVGQVDFPDDTTLVRVAASGTTAYVATWQGLYVVDATNPADPVAVGEPLEGFFIAVTVDGSRLYVAMRHLAIFDISSPLSPVLVGSYLPGFGSAGDSIAVEGNRVYVSHGEAGVAHQTISCFDASNPASPTKLGFVISQAGLEALAVHANRVYANTQNGLHIFRFINPVYPVLESIIHRKGIVDVAALPSGQIVAGVREDPEPAGGIEIFSAPAQPTPAQPAPTLAASIYRPERVRAIAIQGQACYATDEGVLRIYDLSGAAPSILAEHAEGGLRDLAVSGDRVYALDESEPGADVPDRLLVFQTTGIAAP